MDILYIVKLFPLKITKSSQEKRKISGKDE